MLNLIALGNRLRGDDGIGPIVLQRLGRMKEGRNFNLVEAASDAFVLLEYLNGKEPIIVIDCADMGLAPGTVRKIELETSKLGTINAMISLHGFSFAEIYDMAKQIGPLAPTTLLGVQPASLEFGAKLSSRVEAAIPKILDLIIKEAQNYA